MRRVWLLCLLLAAWEPFTAEQKDVRDGNERYERGDYSGAGQAYSRALPQLPGEPAVRFDLGAALYQAWRQASDSAAKQQLLEGARQSWSAVAESPQTDARLRSRAHYNLGNAALDEGKPDDAVKAYQQALKEDPLNDDARHNLELARQTKKPPPPQGGGDKKNQDQKQQKQDQNGQGDDQSQQEQKQPQQGDQPQDQQKQPSPKEDDPKPDQQKDEQQDPQKGQQQAEQQKDAQDDADRKLRALERRSRDLQVDKQRSAERRMRRKADDW